MECGNLLPLFAGQLVARHTSREFAQPETSLGLKSGDRSPHSRSKVVRNTYLIGLERLDRLIESAGNILIKPRCRTPDEDKPTTFVYDNRIILPAGESALDLTTWKYVEIPMNISCDVRAEARGTYRDHVFSGLFTTNVSYFEMFKVTVSGTFEIHVT